MADETKQETFSQRVERLVREHNDYEAKKHIVEFTASVARGTQFTALSLVGICNDSGKDGLSPVGFATTIMRNLRPNSSEALETTVALQVHMAICLEELNDGISNMISMRAEERNVSQFVVGEEMKVFAEGIMESAGHPEMKASLEEVDNFQEQGPNAVDPKTMN